jgi:hypothetical protein
MATNISVETTTSIFTLNETSGSHSNHCLLVGNMQFAINISEKPSASIFWYSTFKNIYPQCGGTWLLWNIGTYLPNYTAPQITRHIFIYDIPLWYKKSGKEARTISQNLILCQFLLLATYFGSWKSQRQASKYIHEERQCKHKSLKWYCFM